MKYVSFVVHINFFQVLKVTKPVGTLQYIEGKIHNISVCELQIPGVVKRDSLLRSLWHGLNKKDSIQQKTSTNSPCTSHKVIGESNTIISLISFNVYIVSMNEKVKTRHHESLIFPFHEVCKFLETNFLHFKFMGFCCRTI